MDLAYFLNQRLAFVEYFYATTTANFEEIKRKIEAGEPPYLDERNVEYADEPAFLREWEDASTAVTVIGAACLVRYFTIDASRVFSVLHGGDGPQRVHTEAARNDAERMARKLSGLFSRASKNRLDCQWYRYQLTRTGHLNPERLHA